MEVIGIQTPLIKPDVNLDCLVELVLNSIGNKEKIELRNEDVLVFASSVVSTVTGRIRDLEDIEPSKKAKKLGEESDLDERFVETIIQESDQILFPFKDCILTVKDDMLRINAGVDRTNVQLGKVLLLPKTPNKTAGKIKGKIETRTGKRMGVIISDSHVNPLRRGTTGQAIGTSGIKESLDFRNQKDLYGRKLKITFQGVADQLSAAAQLIMGEADESTPVVIIRGTDAAFSDKPGESIKIPPDKCVYSRLLGLK